MLRGYKAYIVAIVGVLVNGAAVMGYIPEAFIPAINSILGFLGLAAIRAGVAKLGE